MFGDLGSLGKAVTEEAGEMCRHLDRIEAHLRSIQVLLVEIRDGKQVVVTTTPPTTDKCVGVTTTPVSGKFGKQPPPYEPEVK